MWSFLAEVHVSVSVPGITHSVDYKRDGGNKSGRGSRKPDR